MADKHPYISGTGGIVSAINQFRKSLPTKITAETLQKLGIASNNESYLISILRFVGITGDDGSRTSVAASVFSKHDASEFEQGFSDMVKSAYGDLFEIHGESAWNLDPNKLISFFRGADKTSDIVGRRQATTFQALASLAGHGDGPTIKPATPVKGGGRKQPAAKKIAKQGSRTVPAGEPDKAEATRSKPSPARDGGDFGLTVRIEVNLPAGADRDTYDSIFRSIRENLLNGK